MEIEHKFTQNIVCPYCGLEYLDSGDYDCNGTIICLNENCEKEFKFERIITVDYSTTKI